MEAQNNSTVVSTFFTETYAFYLDLFLLSAWRWAPEDVEFYVFAYNVHEETLNEKKEKFRLYPIKWFSDNDSDEVICSLLRLSPEAVQLLKEKSDRSDAYFSGEHLYKVFVSVEKRYRWVIESTRTAFANGAERLFHADVDVYFRSPNFLNRGLFRSAINIFFRRVTPATMKVVGGLIWFSKDRYLDARLAEWEAAICEVPIHKRWKDFGQEVIYSSLTHYNEATGVCDLSERNIFSFSKKMEKGADAWLTSNSVLLNDARLRNIDTVNHSDLAQMLGWLDFGMGGLHGNMRVRSVRIQKGEQVMLAPHLLFER
jgi:hypothetical protein